MSQAEINRVASAILKIRELVKSAEATVKERKADKTQLEDYLMGLMASQELTGVKTEGYTFAPRTATYYSVSDRDALNQLSAELNSLEMFGNSLNKEWVKLYAEREGDLPSGVSTYNRQSLSVTKSK